MQVAVAMVDPTEAPTPQATQEVMETALRATSPTAATQATPRSRRLTLHCLTTPFLRSMVVMGRPCTRPTSPPTRHPFTTVVFPVVVTLTSQEATERHGPRVHGS